MPHLLEAIAENPRKVKMRIGWKNAVTDYFTISNGVKQGIVQSVLGPVHITAPTYWYGLLHEWLIHGSFFY